MQVDASDDVEEDDEEEELLDLGTCDFESLPGQDSDEEEETDVARLAARQRQVDFGKNTRGYENYVVAVPK